MNRPLASLVVVVGIVAGCSSHHRTQLLPGPTVYLPALCPDGGVDADGVDPAQVYAEEEAMLATGERLSTGLGKALSEPSDAGSWCVSLGWLPVADHAFCEHPCGRQGDGFVTNLRDTRVVEPLEAGPDSSASSESSAGDAESDVGEDAGGYNTEPVSLRYSSIYLEDTKLCITNLCGPPNAIAPNHFISVIDIPYHCTGGVVTCDCLPPDVCGYGACAGVVGNDISCKCP